MTNRPEKKDKKDANDSVHLIEGELKHLQWNISNVLDWTMINDKDKDKGDIDDVHLIEGEPEHLPRNDFG